MNELFEIIEAKIKASVIHERYQVQRCMMISVIRLMVRRMENTCCFHILKRCDI